MPVLLGLLPLGELAFQRLAAACWCASRSRRAGRRRPSASRSTSRACTRAGGRRAGGQRPVAGCRRAWCRFSSRRNRPLSRRPAAGVEHLLVQADAVGADEHEPRVRADQHVLQRRVVADDGGDPVQADVGVRDGRPQQPGGHGDQRVAEVGEDDVVAALGDRPGRR